MSLQIEIEVKGLDEQVRKLEQFDQIAGRHLRRGMERSMAVMASKILPNVPIGATKGLYNSMGSEISQSGTTITGKYGSSLSEDYPSHVENGRPAMIDPKPTASDLESWVKRKLSVSGQREVWRIAGIVAWRIYNFGTKGQHFMANGLRAAKPMLGRVWREVGEWIVKDLEVHGGR